MRIACLSGKGGAGKTLTAVNLAAAAGTATYIDCDVEEPNGRLFFKPDHLQTENVSTLIPSFDATKCTGCKKCVEFCRFHALIYIKDQPMLFPEVCHSCGGCSLVCPEGAVHERERIVGTLEIGMADHIRVITGILNPGEASGIPVIQAALKHSDDLTIIDCPPGSACSVMESVQDADFSLIVVEPTAFGFHNFKMVHELLSLINKKCGVVINKQDDPYEPLETYLKEHHLPVLARIPYDPDIASLASSGSLIIDKDPQTRDIFDTMLQRIGELL